MRRLLLAIMLLCFVNLLSATTLLQTRIEQTAALPITNGNTIAERQIFAVCAPLQSGSVISVYTQAEVTDPYSLNVGIGYVIRAWDYFVDPATGASTFVSSWNSSPPVMTNVTPNTHHLVVPLTLSDTVVYHGTANTRCYTLVLWAVSSNGTGNIIVEQGYGYLQVLVH